MSSSKNKKNCSKGVHVYKEWVELKSVGEELSMKPLGLVCIHCCYIRYEKQK